MAFTIYRSTDAGAPVLTGETGKLVALLKACLVDGYGAKAAAGWTEPYTGVSKGAFKQGAGSCGFYLRVKDDGCDETATPTLATFKEAWITGYETMTDVDTGTVPFPSAAMGVGGVAMVVARKSVAASAVVRAWKIFADSRTLYVFIYAGDIANTFWAFSFGDFISLVTGDPHSCMIIARSSVNSAVGTSEWFGTLCAMTATIATWGRTFLAKDHLGVGSSIRALWLSDASIARDQTNIVTGYSGLTFPNPADGGLFLSRIRLCDPVTGGMYTLRGYMRGLWSFCHSLADVADADTVSGTGDLVGRSFEFVKQGSCVSGAGSPATIATLETSDTLDVV